MPSMPPEVRDLVEQFIDGMDAAIIVTDHVGRIMYANAAARAAEGTPIERLLGRSILMGLEGEDLIRIKQILSLFRRDGCGRMTRRVRVGRQLLEERFIGIADITGRFSGLVIVREDVTERVKQTEEALRIACEDALTGLGNRRAFDDALGRQMLFSLRQRCALSLLFIDIDGFKLYNDKYGHPSGDHVLQQIADILRRSVRQHVDEIYRYGGDEFVVLLPATRRSEARAAAERIESVFTEQGLDSIGLSIGMSVFRRGETARSFVERADRALYRAKNRGGGLIEAL
jgi:diguanylate cyclase (GGDEF)-like protein/PAS domain S-box-containing protein